MPRDGLQQYAPPPGTQGIPNYTVESARYNAFVADISADQNAARPIIAGGTGATDALSALTNLSGEMEGQIVTNFDLMVFVSGSFYCAGSTVGAPTTNPCTGICYSSDALPAPPAAPLNQNMFLEARDVTTGLMYVRQKVAGVWINSGTWKQQGGSLADLDARFVNITGDTMTGALQITSLGPGADATFRGNLSVDAGQTDNSANGIEWKSSLSGAGYGYRAATIFDGGTNVDWVLQGRQNAAAWSAKLTVKGSDGSAKIASTTASTSPVTGALTVAGGVGVGGAVNVGAATASTTPATGALTVAGGVGVGGALNVAGKLAVTASTAAMNDQLQVVLGGAAATSIGLFQAGVEQWSIGMPGGSALLTFTNGGTVGAAAAKMTLSSAGALAVSGNVTSSGGHSILDNTAVTQTGLNCAVGISYLGGGSRYGIVAQTRTAGTNYPVLFYNSAGTQVGTISQTDTNTAYNTASDERLKEDLKSFDAGNIVDDTAVYDFKWRTTGERAYGVIAQQAVTVYPTAITHNEETDFWGVDYSKYVPVLLQELKALRARVLDLEGRLDAKPA